MQSTTSIYSEYGGRVIFRRSVTHKTRKHPRYLLPNTWEVDFASNIGRPKLKVSKILCICDTHKVVYPVHSLSAVFSSAADLCLCWPCSAPRPCAVRFPGTAHNLLSLGRNGTLWQNLPWFSVHSPPAAVLLEDLSPRWVRYEDRTGKGFGFLWKWHILSRIRLHHFFSLYFLKLATTLVQGNHH